VSLVGPDMWCSPVVSASRGNGGYTYHSTSASVQYSEDIIRSQTQVRSGFELHGSVSALRSTLGIGWLTHSKALASGSEQKSSDIESSLEISPARMAHLRSSPVIAGSTFLVSGCGTDYWIPIHTLPSCRDSQNVLNTILRPESSE